MDFKGKRSSHISTSSTTSIGRSSITSLGEFNWDRYHQRLLDHNIKQNSQRWYAVRVEALLKSCPAKRLVEITAEDVRKFLQAITNNPTLQDWQILQAIDAIQILCTEVLDRNRFSSINWDELRLGATSIASSHATLARESVTDEKGKPKYVVPPKGYLAEVFAQFQNEMESFLVELRSRHYSIRTEQSYEQWILRLLARHRDKPAQQLGGEQIKAFINDLVVRGNVSASTRNQALSAILFFYKHVLGKNPEDLDGIAHARRPKRLPVVLTRAEVHALLKPMTGTPWLVAALLYGAGLRLMECVRLRVMDVDFGYKQITVRHGKGGKDRVVPLPGRCIDALRQHLEEVKKQHNEGS